MHPRMPIEVKRGPRLPGVVGWSDGDGQLPALARPTYFDYSRARAYCAYSMCWGEGVLYVHFLLSSIISLSFLWEMTLHGLKLCLKGPLGQKQLTKLVFRYLNNGCMEARVTNAIALQ